MTMNNRITKTMRAKAGFTLVELIVVIAILGILAGVGTVGYSGYIKKANMAADQQLAAGVANGMVLQSYMGANGGFVVLTDQGMIASGDMADAMLATYGEGYEDMALKAEWQSSGGLSAPASVANSSYVTKIGTEKLMGDVQDCTKALGQFMGAISGGNATSAVNNLKSKLDTAENPVFTNILKDAGYETEADYANVSVETMANATMFSVADYVKNNSAAVQAGFSGNTNAYLGSDILTYMDDEKTMMYNAACWYASLEGLVGYLDDPAATAAFEQINMTGNTANILQNMQNAFYTIGGLGQDANGPTALGTKMQAYYTPDAATGKSQAELDGEAFISIMTKINDEQANYTSADQLKDGNLMTSTGVSNAVNAYVGGAQIQTSLSSSDLTADQQTVVTKVINGTYEGSGAVIMLNGNGCVCNVPDLYATN